MISSGSIPVIDLFAGPGGLGEGFSAWVDSRGRRPFKIALSIEKDPVAHQTLLLRAFFRQFPPGHAPRAYYQRLRGELSAAELFRAHDSEAAAARSEAWHATLGDDKSAPLPELRSRVRAALGGFQGGEDRWVLIGGPPCQAYSLARRSLNRGIAGYRLEDDPRARPVLTAIDASPCGHGLETGSGALGPMGLPCGRTRRKSLSRPFVQRRENLFTTGLLPVAFRAYPCHTPAPRRRGVALELAKRGPPQ